ncbi:hypothetical protein [Sinanaerobacter chloroacetimidivorans]|jgi:hypothetical protein|uniref:Uncharacterized protein n=1 Tax=Sinanaerobacter chloroacetimidivorans TaxID=2818044 RepID=A0A8J8B1F4_9FIRM|nr:hypothetical protein [Sinanaerobacter chloroacetimidivorans]MBR0598194.1 hypothetical protein [Sinanaerobacter chloroacetimidivorans]
MVVKKDFDPQCITYSQMNLIFNARIYYRRLTTWTRAFLISRYFGIGTAEELFDLLYRESLDIGNMLQIVFGRVYSEQYSQLLSEFAIALRELISAQLEGNTEAMNQSVDRLYRNVQERAVFLEAINPYWSEASYKALFDTYIQYVIEAANALITGDYSKDIEIYDRLTAHTNRMGDVFAEGLYNYITSGASTVNLQPEGGEQCITYEQMNTIYGIRMFWFELVTWVRNYMLSRYMGLGNTEEVYARLQRVPVEYVNAVKQIFVDLDTEAYLKLFYTYIDLLDAFITAQIEGDIDKINQVTQCLYQNADERAAFVAALNPFWEEEEWRNRLHNNLRSTIDESTTFLMGDYSRNIDIFSRLLDQAENTSNYFAQGLFNYINFNPQTPL